MSHRQDVSLRPFLISSPRNSLFPKQRQLVPRSLELAAEQDAEFRQGLPLNFLSFMGLVHEGTADDSKRQRFIRRAKTLMTKLIEHAPFDAAADQVPHISHRLLVMILATTCPMNLCAQAEDPHHALGSRLRSLHSSG